MKPYLLTTGALFALLAAAHIWRIIAEWPSLNVPEAGIGVVAAALSIWAWSLHRSAGRGELR